MLRTEQAAVKRKVPRKKLAQMHNDSAPPSPPPAATKIKTETAASTKKVSKIIRERNRHLAALRKQVSTEATEVQERRSLLERVDAILDGNFKEAKRLHSKLKEHRNVLKPLLASEKPSPTGDDGTTEDLYATLYKQLRTVAAIVNVVHGELTRIQKENGMMDRRIDTLKQSLNEFVDSMMEFRGHNVAMAAVATDGTVAAESPVMNASGSSELVPFTQPFQSTEMVAEITPATKKRTVADMTEEESFTCNLETTLFRTWRYDPHTNATTFFDESNKKTTSKKKRAPSKK